MLKELKRYSKSKTFCFVARVTNDLWCIGLHFPSGTTVFFDSFLTAYDQDWPDNAELKVLFAAAVLPPFFRKNPVFVTEEHGLMQFELDDLPEFGICPHMNPDKPAGQPAWEGEYTYKGGSLVRLMQDRNPLNYEMGAEGVVIERLIVQEHAAEISLCPVTIGSVDFDLRERLFCCATLGRNVDPLKAVLFPDHPDMQDDLFSKSHYHFKHAMPLIGAVYDVEQKAWIEQTADFS